MRVWHRERLDGRRGGRGFWDDFAGLWDDRVALGYDSAGLWYDRVGESCDWDALRVGLCVWFFGFWGSRQGNGDR
jgi:hypothetical protein